MQNIIEIKNLTTKYGDRIIHDNISFNIQQKDIFAILGGSGSGKSTLLNTMIFLKPPTSGEVRFLDKNIWTLDEEESLKMKLKCGVLFQFGALFSSLSVLDNITITLREYTSLPNRVINDLAYMWIHQVGLKPEVANLYPSELSGGMIKRVALARALSLSPKVLFLDEPTSGLDPKSARHFDELIKELRDILGISIVMITHDMDSVKSVVNRLIILKERKIFFEGTISELERQTESLDLFLYQI
ncbi:MULTISPECIES: ABC transporter ATP-binding protein [Helicobacter]|uniref:ATP-binding cassette domain-containing protein n=1 Tax=Helicobacter ibis TaxID=2962633 RepID=A0ABT4VEX6_9HELI|nr:MULTISPECIES: ATP-binding cassette domain-containing protein [Helicobacter]MDA3967136.1 ATP-binding cassette domain-containing protein [Helicobacter sp. WB40]MDA3969264.1 ATP-binding cassette domain-containing protein [Helicobacter ibis]